MPQTQPSIVTDNKVAPIEPATSTDNKVTHVEPFSEANKKDAETTPARWGQPHTGRTDVPVKQPAYPHMLADKDAQYMVI